jgi:hypothetical protein
MCVQFNKNHKNKNNQSSQMVGALSKVCVAVSPQGDHNARHQLALKNGLVLQVGNYTVRLDFWIFAL